MKKVIATISLIIVILVGIYLLNPTYFKEGAFRLEMEDLYMQYFRDKENIDQNHVLTTMFNGSSIIVNKDDQVVSRQIRLKGKWEREETQIMLKLLKPGQIMVEIGANYGYYTFLSAKVLGSTGSIISYEANPDVFKYLEQSVKLNVFDSFVQVKNLAVSDRVFDSYLVYDLSNVGGGYVLQPGAKGCENNPSCRPIRSVTIDKDLADLPKIDILRTDAEGSESFIMHGAEKLIKRSPDIIIMLEWGKPHLSKYGINLNEFADYLAAFGFKFWQVIRKEGTRDGTLKSLTKEELAVLEYGNIMLSRNDIRLD